jgi:hypothetical protein
VDRVDRWLSAQHGWRRLLIGWFVFAPVFLGGGLLWSGSGNLDDRGTVAAGSILLRVAIAALAGIPLAAVLLWLQTRRPKSRPWAPLFSWRLVVGFYVFMAGVCTGAYGETQTLAWRRQHVSFKAILLADAMFFAMVIWNTSYYRKLRRRAEADAQAATS